MYTYSPRAHMSVYIYINMYVQCLCLCCRTGLNTVVEPITAVGSVGDSAVSLPEGAHNLPGFVNTSG